ncbi:phosphotransferase [Brevibacillus dissolubilis]|uniref:phosphotransferase n=1 Tax=Brevibacillus dissolubilis TaxID=1844116 RepID=UPI001115FAC5|nr:phosphotransferase [Brevibacillus dissolubilis]
MDQTFQRSLERAFRCHIYGVKQKRTVYLVRTNRGLWVVKGYKELDKANWVTHLAQALRQQGFYQTVEYVPTETNELVYPYGNRFFTVMKAIDGREANYAHSYDMKKSITTLGKFHQAAQGFHTMPTILGQKPPLMDKWERRLETFKRISEKINTRGPQNRLEQIILSMNKEIKRDGEEAVTAMKILPISEEMSKAATYGTLAHRDVASHNFMLTEPGTCFLIDLDTVDQDMQLVDLVQFMSRMLFLHGYSFAAFQDALDSYQKVNPLTDTQITMLYTMLRYPDNALREITGIYAKHPGYRARGVIQLLTMERTVRRQRRKMLGLDEESLQSRLWSGVQL